MGVSFVTSVVASYFKLASEACTILQLISRSFLSVKQTISVSRNFNFKHGFFGVVNCPYELTKTTIKRRAGFSKKPRELWVASVANI